MAEVGFYHKGIIWVISIVGKIPLCSNCSKTTTTQRVNMGFLGRQSIEDLTKLFSVLEDKNYSWRSIEALVEGTRFTKERVSELIELENRDSKHIISKKSEEGDILYASAVHLIRKALENPEYVWRTIDGLLKDTPLTSDQIHSVLGELTVNGELVTATSEVDGKMLFTTRKHYQEKENPWNKLLSSLSGSIRTK